MTINLAIPLEGAYSDIERNWIDNEPPGLFPEDQNSYWGQVRKVFSDYLQTQADLLTTWWNNLDPRAVGLDDIPEWEYELGIPFAAAGRTLAQRRQFVLSRYQQGAFTRTRRKNIVEAFIVATFGDSIIFDAFGVAFTVGGIPFGSGSFSLPGTYTIRENGPYGKNYLVNGNFETNTTGWTPFVGTEVLTSDVTMSKSGTKSAKVVTTAINQGIRSNGTAVVATNPYTFGVWLQGTAGRSYKVQILRADLVTVVATVTVVGTGAPQFVSVSTASAPATENNYVVVTNFTAGADTFYIDEAMLNDGVTALSFVDTAVTPFNYEVRLLNSLGVDVVGLQRELDHITPSSITYSIIQTPTP